MSQYGKVIAKYRKLNNLTQSQLAEKLFISPQAVSKWELDQSEPDLATIKKITEIFHLTLDQFFSEEKSLEEKVEAVNPDKERCDICLDHFDHGALIKAQDLNLCQHCLNTLDEEDRSLLSLKESMPKVFQGIKLGGKLPFYIGWGLGIVIFVVLIISHLISSNNDMSFIEYLLISFGISIFSITFGTQLLYGSWLRDFLIGFFGKTVGMPGVLFELSIDGLIFLILVKILLGFIVMAISLAVALLGIVVTIAISPITYTVELVTKIRRGFDYEIV